MDEPPHSKNCLDTCQTVDLRCFFVTTADLDGGRFNTIDIADRIHLRAASFCMAQGDNSDEIGRNISHRHGLGQT